MSEAMVNATITQLLSMDEMIQRVDPEIVAKILLPQSGAILEPIVRDLSTDLPPWIRSAVLASAKSESGWQQMVCFRFLKTLTQGVQENVDRVLSLQNCVVEQMMADRYVVDGRESHSHAFFSTHYHYSFVSVSCRIGSYPPDLCSGNCFKFLAKRNWPFLRTADLCLAFYLESFSWL